MRYQLKQEHNPLLTNEQLVESFLEMNHRWFSSPDNGFFGYKQTFYHYCLVRLETGEYGEDYGDKNLIWVERYFDEYIGLYNEVGDK